MTCRTTSGAHAGARPIERKIRHIPSTLPQPLRFRQPGCEGATPIMKPATFASRPPWRRCVRPIRRSTNRHPANGKETAAHRCPRDLRKGSGRPDLPAFRHRWETRPAAPVWLPYSPVTVVCLPRCWSIRRHSSPMVRRRAASRQMKRRPSRFRAASQHCQKTIRNVTPGASDFRSEHATGRKSQVRAGLQHFQESMRPARSGGGIRFSVRKCDNARAVSVSG
jgi:hypothetical protein